MAWRLLPEPGSFGRTKPDDATTGSIAGRLARVQSRPEPPERVAEPGTSGVREAVQRWRLVLARTALAGDLVQRDLQAAWDAALIQSGLPIAGLDEQRPKPRFVVAAPLASAVAGEAELADLWLVSRLPRWCVREALAQHLPPGHALVDLYDVWLGDPPLPGRVAASRYRAALDPAIDAEPLKLAAETLLASPTLPRERRKGETSVAYDLRPFLDAIEVEPTPEATLVRMTLLHDPAKGVGRPEEALAALAEALGARRGQPDAAPLPLATLTREALVLAEPAPAAQTAPTERHGTALRGKSTSRNGSPRPDRR